MADDTTKFEMNILVLAIFSLVANLLCACPAGHLLLEVEWQKWLSPLFVGVLHTPHIPPHVHMQCQINESVAS